MRATHTQPLAYEACILAGGLSSRMGRDKGRLRLGSHTMPGMIRITTAKLGLRTQVIRRDSVARCGPIGGILTALNGSRADVMFILACDMPFISAPLLRGLKRVLQGSDQAVFTSDGRRASFPCLLRREACLPIVIEQIQQGEFSLQSFVRRLGARLFRPRRGAKLELVNINTPEEFENARRICGRS